MSRIIEDFIENTNSAPDIDSLFHYFKNYLSTLSFDRIIYTFFTDQKGQKAGHGIMSNYPEDWVEYYKEKNYLALDPVAQQAYQTSEPFFWKNLHYKLMNPHQKIIMLECEEAGLHHGIGVPLHGAQRALAGIGLATSNKEKPELNKVQLAKIGIVAHQFHVSYYNLLKDEKVQKPLLTKKENEILKWLAIGKTAYEISVILNCTERTVQFHTYNIYQKLEANSKTLAIIKAIKLGLIELDKIIV